MNHACPKCGTSTTRPGRCTTCRPKATPEQNQRKRERPTYKTVYHTKRWRDLRAIVLRRDAYTCRQCGTRPANNAGHIIPFKDSDDPRAWSLMNIITQCAQCNGREAGKRGNPKKRGTIP